MNTTQTTVKIQVMRNRFGQIHLFELDSRPISRLADDYEITDFLSNFTPQQIDDIKNSHGTLIEVEINPIALNGFRD